MMKRPVVWKLLSIFLVMLALCSGVVIPFPAEASGAKKDIVRIDFVHYAKQLQGAKRQTDPGYKLMGVQWKTGMPVVYRLNTSSIPFGLDKAAVLSDFSASSETWDSGTASTELFFDTLNDTTKHYGALNGENTVEFGLYSGNTGVIAVTSVWFNRKTKSIVEFDMLLNTFYAWGDAGNTAAAVMDIQNIATHEFGHAIGLSDIYNNAYSDVTMYGYADFNETDKRDLASEDLIGLRLMYGQ